MPPASSSRSFKKRRMAPYAKATDASPSPSTVPSGPSTSATASGSPSTGPSTLEVIQHYASTVSLDEELEEGATSVLDKDHRKNKRNRSTLSCWYCHKNKRRCDRGRPCGRCRSLNIKCVYEHDNKAPCHGLEDENVRLRDRVSELETILRLYRGKPDVEISQRETYDWVLTIPEVIWHLMQGVVDFAAEADQIFNHISPVGEAGEVQRRLQEWLRGLSGTVSTAMHEARKSRRDMPADLHNGGHMPTPVSSPPSLAANFSTSPEHAVPPTYPAMHSPQSIHSQSPVIAQPIQEPVYHSYAGAVDGTVASYIEEATDLSAFYGDPSIYEAFVAMPQELGSNLFLEGWASEMNAYVTAG